MHFFVFVYYYYIMWLVSFNVNDKKKEFRPFKYWCNWQENVVYPSDKINWKYDEVEPLHGLSNSQILFVGHRAPWMSRFFLTPENY